MAIKITVQTDALRRRLARLESRLNPQAMDRAVERAAVKTQVALVKATPKRWTGTTRKGWQVEKPRPGARILVNRQKSMLFLERGTANGGTGMIKPKHKKFLYVPLRRNAAAGWKPSLKRGRDYLLKKEVRGMKPRRIIANERPKAQQRLKDEIKQEVRVALNG